MTKRFIRPVRPRTGLTVGARDRRILELVARFRFLTAEQLRDLVAPRTARRVLQRRFRLLFEHQVLDRHRLARSPTTTRAATPLYSVGERGAALLGDHEPYPRRPTTGLPSTIHHGLVATDFLVALRTALARAPGAPLVDLHPEAELWTQLARWRLRTPRRRPAIVPDGAITVAGPGNAGRSTYALEVIRADIRGGSRTFIAKLVRYGELVSARFFRDAFGFERLRAVIVAAPTMTRARHLRELAAKASITVPVVFTAFAPGSRAFTADAVSGPAFTDRLGQPFTIVPSPVCP